MNRIDTDILVIGGGGAGARAAIEASKYSGKVTLVSKGIFGKGGATCMAVFSYCAAFGHSNKRDNPDVHFGDTVKAGCGLNNQKLAALTHEAPDRMLDLQKFGMRFEKSNDKFIQARLPGHTFPRACFKDFHTGRYIMNALRNEVLRLQNIKVLNEVIVIKILTTDGRISGAIGLDLRSGKFIIFECKAVVLATGGGGQIYSINSVAADATGDGYSLACRAGAELVDMEFVQFYPLSLVYPSSLRGLTAVGLLREVFGHNLAIYNSAGERFMNKYDPKRLELTTRDVLSRAIYSEVREGRGSEHGGVYMRVSGLPRDVVKSKIERNLPGQVFQGISLPKLGLDICKETLEVAPAAHYFMGGVLINEKCETTLPGLYACGEVAGGIHGANRLAGNALPETQVFGARAGRYAAEYALTSPYVGVNEDQVESERERVFALLNRQKGIKPIMIKRQVQQVMQEKVGVLRNEVSLKMALQYIRDSKKSLEKVALAYHGCAYNCEWKDALELYFLLDVAELVTFSAVLRTESRGAHYRQDYPERNDKNWLRNIIVNSINGQIAFRINHIVNTRISHKKLKVLEEEGNQY